MKTAGMIFLVLMAVSAFAQDNVAVTYTEEALLERIFPDPIVCDIGEWADASKGVLPYLRAPSDKTWPEVGVDDLVFRPYPNEIEAAREKERTMKKEVEELLAKDKAILRFRKIVEECGPLSIYAISPLSEDRGRK